MTNTLTPTRPVGARRTLLSARKRRLAWAMLLPAFAFTLAYIGWPLVSITDISLRDISIPVLSKLHSEPLTLMNYTEGFTPNSFWKPLRNTLVYMTAVNVPAFTIGLGLALFFHQRFPGHRLMQVICLLPWAVPGVAAGAQ